LDELAIPPSITDLTVAAIETIAMESQMVTATFQSTPKKKKSLTTFTHVTKKEYTSTTTYKIRTYPIFQIYQNCQNLLLRELRDLSPALTHLVTKIKIAT
jgi:hypothetical protein